ncbi:MAG: hypothetical protein O3A92_13215 [Verrucomicrobia bacterium]|nr:hypothetical protein [Verrucomicrobiota bacterium]
MWNRINYADWVTIIPILAFLLTFTVFVLLVTRTLLMKKPRLKQLASLPLDQGSTGVPPVSQSEPGTPRP